MPKQSRIEKEMAVLDARIRVECRQQYREEGNTDCPDRYKFGSCEGLVWTSEATKIWLEYTQSSHKGSLIRSHNG